MYAVIATGGKQKRVSVGARYKVEKLVGELNDSVKFEDVLLVNDGKVNVGTPYVDKAVVEATIVDQIKGPKIRIIKMRRRKHSMTKTGHRQKYTWVKISSIKVGDKTLAS